jgi:RNA polymerase sigma-70 factor (sigma-E family)
MPSDPVTLAYEQFVRARGPALLRFAYLLTGDYSVAEDLTQDCLTSAYWRWPTLADPEAYLRRAITNGVRSRFRRLGLHRRWERLQPPSTSADPAEIVTESDALWAAIRRLRPQHRSVLVLRYYEDLSDSDIAQILGCSESTVRTWARRGLSRLREVHAQTEPEAEVGRHAGTRP